LSQRYPGDQADVGRGQQFLGGDLPQLGDPPGEPPVGSSLAAAQVDSAGGLDIPLGVEEQDHGRGEGATIEVDQRRVVDDLVGDAGLGKGGDLQDVAVGFGLPVSPDLDQAVGQPAGLDQLGWKRLPGDDGMGPPGLSWPRCTRGIQDSSHQGYGARGPLPQQRRVESLPGSTN